jgi:RNA polymerase sigma-70 factor (ECF subfamily)
MNSHARRSAVPVDNDEARFVDIYRRYSKPIQAYCARRTPGPQVADAVADVFLVAWRRIDQIPTGDAALPWLYGVAYRVLSHQWRHKVRSRRLVERLQGLAQVEAFSPDVLVVRSEEYRVVLAASARLRAIDQEILRLTLWEELPHADVAVILGIAVSAVKERAYRARRNLAVEYQKLSGERQPPAAREGGGS